jgi:hypothetical protein
MKEFCCNQFKFHHDGSSQMGLNIRIIKLSDWFMERGELKGSPYRFLITEGYTKLDDSIKTMYIKFCPYCGTELQKKYTSDEYINENEHDS